MNTEIKSKVCTKCGEEKLASEFNKCSRVKSGLKSRCKSCRKAYRESNKEKIATTRKKHYQKNKEAISDYNRKYREENRSDILEYKRKLRATKEYSEYMREYRKKNSEKRRVIRKSRYHNDPVYRAMDNIRTQVTHKLRDRKSKKTIEYLGCSPEYFYNAVMMGQNLQADHIYPVSWFDMDNPDHVKVAWHHSNFQPLDAKSNIEKGNRYAGTPDNIICYKKDFDVEVYVAMMLPRINFSR